MSALLSFLLAAVALHSCTLYCSAICQRHQDSMSKDIKSDPLRTGLARLLCPISLSKPGIEPMRLHVKPVKKERIREPIANMTAHSGLSLLYWTYAYNRSRKHC